MLLQRSLGSTAAASKPITARKHILKHTQCHSSLHKQQQQLHHSPARHCCPPAAAAADAAPSQEDPTHQAAAPSSQQPDASASEQQQVQDVEQQQAPSSSIGLPPGLSPLEPPDEEPKKLSAAARLSEALASTSITIFGDDTELNWAVCQALSKRIGWFPVSTRKVLLGLQKAETLDQLIAREGREAVVESEAKMLKGMRDQLRCCIATIGDAAAADVGLYPNLYGTILIWLDEDDKRNPKAPSAARALYQQQAEIRGKVDVRKGGFGLKDKGVEDKASQAASQLVKAMHKLLKENKDILERKRLYLAMGCRGDWPELKPPEWSPVVEGLDRKPVA